MLLRGLPHILAVAGLACASVEETGDIYYEPEVLLGTGEYEWEDLSEGGSVYVIFGPQGGYHLLGSIRTRGIEAGDHKDLTSSTNPTVQFSVIWQGEEYVMSGSITQGLDPVVDQTAEWSHELVGRFAILDITTDEAISGEIVNFGVSVTTADGLRYSDTMELTVVPHPNNNIE